MIVPRHVKRGNYVHIIAKHKTPPIIIINRLIGVYFPADDFRRISYTDMYTVYESEWWLRKYSTQHVHFLSTKRAEERRRT